MSVAVFPINVSVGMGMAKKFSTVIADFGDGFEQRGNKNQAYTHADGQGAVTSHKGQWSFQIKLAAINQANGDPTQECNELWKFYTDQLGPTTAFYFYNPIEAIIDLTGTSTTGRYLVRFADPMLSLEAFALKLHRGQLNLIEVRPTS